MCYPYKIYINLYKTTLFKQPMGLFSGKKNTDNTSVKDLPSLPDLGPVPQRNPYASPVDSQPNVLPQFPHNSDTVSQKIIKNAVSGQEESDFEVGLDEDQENLSPYQTRISREDIRPEKTTGYTRPAYNDEEFQNIERLPVNIVKPRRQESYSKPSREDNESFEIKKDDSVFIQVDKFNEIAKTMKDVRIKIAEIEKTISKIQRMREEEEAELMTWESEVKKVKSHVDNIDQNIFEKL